MTPPLPFRRAEALVLFCRLLSLLARRSLWSEEGPLVLETPLLTLRSRLRTAAEEGPLLFCWCLLWLACCCLFLQSLVELLEELVEELCLVCWRPPPPLPPPPPPLLPSPLLSFCLSHSLLMKRSYKLSITGSAISQIQHPQYGSMSSPSLPKVSQIIVQINQSGIKINTPCCNSCKLVIEIIYIIK